MIRALRAGLVIFFVWLGGFLWFAVGLTSGQTGGGPDLERPTDGIAVLTGGGTRISAAIELLADGKAERLMISGVNRDVAPGVLRRAVGVNSNLFDCCIDLGREAEDTVGNAIEIAQWADRNNFHSLRIVTAAYHMPRSLFELRRAMRDIELIPHPVFEQSVKLAEWWAWPGTTLLVVSEYDKYLLTLIADRVNRMATGVFGLKVGARQGADAS